MLVLSRKVGEEIVIGDDIRLMIVSIQGDRVRLGISAPREVAVDRLEVHENRMIDCEEPMLIPIPAGTSPDR
jgi:carbon storage regulator